MTVSQILQTTIYNCMSDIWSHAFLSKRRLHLWVFRVERIQLDIGKDKGKLLVGLIKLCLAGLQRVRQPQKRNPQAGL